MNKGSVATELFGPDATRSRFSVVDYGHRFVWRVDGSSPDIYVSLSGGGFRATAHHLGVLTAFLRHNLHHRLSYVCGVSGGAIAAGHLGSWLSKRKEDVVGLQALRDFARPLVQLMKSNVRGRIMWGGPVAFSKFWFPGGFGASPLEQILNKDLYQDLPLTKMHIPPLIVLTATDVLSGNNIYLTGAGIGFRPHRLVERHVEGLWATSSTVDVSLSKAVCASAALPGVFHPIQLTLMESDAREYWLQQHRVPQPGGLNIRLVDGGVGDNGGLTFCIDLLTRGNPRQDPVESSGIRKILRFDIGLDRPKQPNRWRLSVLRQVVDRLGISKESMNDRFLSLVADTVGAYYGFHRIHPYIDDDLGMEENLINSLLGVRTDFDEFTDTEIYSLAYAGYKLATFGLVNAEILDANVVGTHDQQRMEFKTIFAEILDPLPESGWVKHLHYSSSRLALGRMMNRKMARVTASPKTGR